VATPDDVTNLTRGDNATVRCDVTGDVSDDVRLTWYKDGDALDTDAERWSVGDGGRLLRLNDVREEDAGQYRCEASRRLQRAYADITITVHGHSLFLLV